MLLETYGLSVTYGGLRAVDDLSLKVRAGSIVGLIGPNGAGKTSFIDGLTGFTATTGVIDFDGERIEHLPAHQRARRGLARTWQSVELFDDLTVGENLRVASEPAIVGSVLADIVHPSRAVDLAHQRWALELMGLGHLVDERPTNLSLGQQKLLGVARALAARPRLVLLDEPAAGLDTAESQALGQRLMDIVDAGITVFLIDHDMGLVLEVCDYVYVIEFGRLLAEGTPPEVRRNDTVIEAYLGETARQAKAAEGAGGLLMDRAVGGPVGGGRPMSIALQITDLTAGHGGVPAVRGLSLTVAEGELVALLGPNGAGKSTTLWTIAGVIRPLGGTIEILDQPSRNRSAHAVARLGVSPRPRGSRPLLPAERQREHPAAPPPRQPGDRRTGLRLLPCPRERWCDGRPGLLSGGEQQMLALGCALVSDPSPADDRRAEPRAGTDHRRTAATRRAPASPTTPAWPCSSSSSTCRRR